MLAEKCMKYMLLCKIMKGNMTEVFALIGSKQGLKMRDSVSLACMRAVAQVRL